MHIRTRLEPHVVANRGNVWDGRPISLIVLAEPLEVLDGKAVPLIELDPPVHQRVDKMGLEQMVPPPDPRAVKGRWGRSLQASSRSHVARCRMSR